MNKRAIDFLNTAIASGLLDDTSEKTLREAISSGQSQSNNDHWYNRMRREEGEEAAEKAFQEWPLLAECTAFGATVRPIVESMLDIAQWDRNDKLVILASPDNEDYGFPFGMTRGGRRTAVIVTNPEHQGCGRTAPDGYGVWGTLGSLKMFAIALLKTEYPEAITHGRQGTFYNLYLVFEPYKLPPKAVTGYTMLDFGADGRVMRRSHYLFPEESRRFFGRKIDNSREDVMSYSSASFESHFFPGAREYILEHLPKLPVYLSAMARITQEHDR